MLRTASLIFCENLAKSTLFTLQTNQIAPGSSNVGVTPDTKALSENTAKRLAPLLPARWWKGRKVFDVTPTAHFCMGGIVTNQQGETPQAGLFAVGEVAAGVHGANRLGGNALAEIFAMGSWVGEWAAERSRIARADRLTCGGLSSSWILNG